MSSLERVKYEHDLMVDDVEKEYFGYIYLLQAVTYYHRYTFEQQLSLALHCKPSDRAFATEEQWKLMGRTLIEGAEGVVLPSPTEEGKTITVYKVNDTLDRNGKKNNNVLWHFNPKTDATVFADVPGDTVPDKVRNLAHIAAMDANIRDENRDLVEASVAYIVLCRLRDENLRAVYHNDCLEAYGRIKEAYEKSPERIQAIKDSGAASKLILDHVGFFLRRGRRPEDVKNFNSTVLRTLVNAQGEIHDRADARGVAGDGTGRHNEGVPHDAGRVLQREVHKPDRTAQGENGNTAVRTSGDERIGVDSTDEHSADAGKRTDDRGNLQGVDSTESAILDMSLRDWYTQNYPTDELGSELSSSILMRDVQARMLSGEDFYVFAGVSDSVIRERIFTGAAKAMGISYDSMYEAYEQGYKISKEKRTAQETLLDENIKQSTIIDSAPADNRARYRYYLNRRPVSPGTVPAGFTEFDENETSISKYGVIYYERPLTRQEIKDYELWTESDAAVENFNPKAAVIANEHDANTYAICAQGLVSLYNSYIIQRDNPIGFARMLNMVENKPDFETQEARDATIAMVRDFRNWAIMRTRETTVSEAIADAEKEALSVTNAPMNEETSSNEDETTTDTTNADVTVTDDSEIAAEPGQDASATANASIPIDYVPENGVVIDQKVSEAIQNAQFPLENDLADLMKNATSRDKKSFFANIIAIQALKNTDAYGEGTPMYEAMREAMRGYTGWGGLSKAFEPTDNSWAHEYEMLRELLTEDEYKAARASTLNSFYTPPEIAKGVWQAIENMGFRQGNILDPAIGTGRFFENMPESIKDASSGHLYGIELDPLTARIAKHVVSSNDNPVSVTNKGFEASRYPDASFDLAITNVPFGDYQLADTSEKGSFLVHDYFTAKMADQVRPGGLVAVVTSKCTMDKRNDSARLYFAQRMELVNAVRLPETVFNESGTSVVSDILLFRRRENNLSIEDAAKEDWVEAVPFANYYVKHDKYSRYTGANLYINKYFERHPEKILGNFTVTVGSHGEATTCLADPDIPVTAESIASALHNENVHYVNPQTLTAVREIPEADLGIALSYHLNETGELVFNTGLEDVIPNLRPAQKERVLAILPVRDAVRDCIAVQSNPDASEAQIYDVQEKLGKAYDTYFKSYGSIALDKTLKKSFSDDVSYPLLCSLEIIRDDPDRGNVYAGKAEIFNSRVIVPVTIPSHADDAQDALTISLSAKGEVDVHFMSQLVGCIPEEVVDELLYDKIFYDYSEGKYVTADEFLSGNVLDKLEDLQSRLKSIESDMANYVSESIVPYEKFRYKARTPEEAEYIKDKNPLLHMSDNADYQTILNYQERRKTYLDSRKNDPQFMAAVVSNNPYSSKEYLDSLISNTDAYLEAIHFSESKMPIYRYVSPVSSAVRAIAEAMDVDNPLKLNSFTFNFMKNKLAENSDRLEEYSNELSRNSLKNEFQAYVAEQQTLIDEMLQHGKDSYLVNARKNIEDIKKGIEALESVKPKPLMAEEISINLGAPWLPVDVVKNFVVDTIGLSGNMDIMYSPYTNTWSITNKNTNNDISTVTMTYGVDENYNAYKIMENILNMKTTKVYKAVTNSDGKEVRVLDEENTQIAQQKADLIKAEFKKWIYKDEKRKNRLVAIYNRRFNNIVPRKYNGQGLKFPGMNAAIKLQEHQRDAVAMSLFGGNALYAHVVGAGKTFEMITSIMESKRLGLSNKAMMVVPNHLTEQTGAEFQRLYPNAKILVATSDEMQPQKRKEFLAKIALYNWDAIIIGNSRFEQIPVSQELVLNTIKKEIDNLDAALTDINADSLIKNSEKRFSVKQIEAAKNNLEAKLISITNKNSKKDQMLTFENLGIDKLVVDEAHYYKNLMIYTKMSNVAGISTNSKNNKTADMLIKTQYINELTNEKGLIFATGTPISNSMTELYTMQRYLQPSQLESFGLKCFDAWAAQFGETTTAYELKPEGKGFQQKTRFSKFKNLPELMNMFNQVADVRTSDMLNLDVPKAEYFVEKIKPSDVQKNMVDILQERAEKVHKKQVEPEEDNMLKITGDGKMLALDQRLINPDFPDDPNSKLNKCVDNVWKIFDETRNKKSTQLIFCDQSTPNPGKWSVYQDIKDKLVARGVKPEEIAFIHDAKDEAQKEALFKKVRSGDVRILIGSTTKMGVGTNVQDKLIATHDLDVPWRPADLEQRLGRIIRQGNTNSNVKVFRYVTEETFDAYLWQLIENKQKFISQIMTSKTPVRSAEDVDEVTLSYAEIKALAIGNPIIKEKIDNDNEIVKLKLAKSNYLSNKKTLRYNIESKFPREINSYKVSIDKLKNDIATLRANTFFDETSGKEKLSITINGKKYASKKDAGEALAWIAKEGLRGKICGEYKGLKLSYAVDPETLLPYVVMSGVATYKIQISVSDPTLTITKMNNVGKKISDSLALMQENLKAKEQALAIAKADYARPFDGEEKLSECLKKAEEYTKQLKEASESKPDEFKNVIDLDNNNTAEKIKKKNNKIAASCR